jgi:hypothetical protein
LPFSFASPSPPRYNQCREKRKSRISIIRGEGTALRHKILYCLRTCFPLGLFVLFVVRVWAQEISPADEQDFKEAQEAVKSAQGALAGKYAPETFKTSQDLLLVADESRMKKDAVKFSQASRLARAYAEMAIATAALKMEEEKLSLTLEELQRVRAEIERLKRNQGP